MENMAEILRIVLPTQLLAGSLADLADKLGYKGRSTLYRIVNGNASERAVAGFCQKLRRMIGIDEESLGVMAAEVVNATRFYQVMKNFMKPKGALTVHEVVEAFVAGKFDVFPEEFRENELNELLSLERTDPDAFYNMLAYFYYKHSDVNYYIKGASHRERCAGVLESLGERFIELYPENGLAATFVYSYSKSDIFNSEFPILGTFIGSLATLLRFFSRPVEVLEAESDIRFLSALHKRDYWAARDRASVILTLAVTDINAGSGHYEVFQIDRESRAIGYVGRLHFLSDEILVLSSETTATSKLGYYRFEDRVLTFEWEDPIDDPLSVGNTWTMLDMSRSQSLRQLDRFLTEDRLFAEKLKKQGVRELPEFKIEDVVISRTDLTLKLKNGNRLSIPISMAPFLQKIKPDDLVQILERESDEMVFVFWPKIMHSLPLEFFAKIPDD